MNEKLNKFKNLFLRNLSLKDISFELGISYATAKRYKQLIINGTEKTTKKKKISSKKDKFLLTKDEIIYIINFYNENAYYFNMKHFYEHFIVNQMGYTFSYSTLKRYFSMFKVETKRIRKKTRKKWISLEKNKDNNEIEKKKFPNLLQKHKVHPRKSKPKYFGEIVEVDASYHLWAKDLYLSLHLFVDKSTSMILGAYFDYKETLEGYYKAFKQVLLNYGIPIKLVTDNRTVFSYILKRTKISYDTNFKRACELLGIDLFSTSIPQKKGTVERKFGTLQDRLASELIFYGINTIEACNDYLATFIKQHNANLNIDNTINAFDSQINEEKIDQILCIYSTRLITKCCISYKNQLYIPIDSDGNKVFIKDKVKVNVLESVNGIIYIEYCENMYITEKIEDKEEFSNLLDIDKKKNTEKSEKKKYIPPKDHPWKRYLKKN